jgi:hypothetical protein
MVASLAAFPARSHAGPAASRRYQRRRAENTPLFKIVSECLERGVLGDRPKAVAAVTRILLNEIETLLCRERLRCAQQATPPAPRPRLGTVSFLRRFGSGLNRHAHLHAAVTDGVFLPGPHGLDGPPAFLPKRPLTAADLAAITERVRRRVIGWFKRKSFSMPMPPPTCSPGRTAGPP